MNTKIAVVIIAILSLLLFTSCQVEPSEKYRYRPPENINDGLEVGALDEVNIDSSLIIKAANKILNGPFREVHSMLIYKDNKLVFEEYFQGHRYQWDAEKHLGAVVSWDRNMLHDVKSVTKSITSVCIGIAIDRGFIKNVHQPIFDYLPEYQHLKTGGKEKITIEHLVTMTSGLEWDEWSAPLSSADNDIIGLWFNCDDQIACILERPLKSEPGTSFTYSGGNTILLGEIIRNATKMDIALFSRKYLFEPQGIDSCHWSIRYPGGVIESAGGLRLTPRAMTKVGVTFLNQGVWQGNRIVSTKWVGNSARTFPGNSGINVPGEASGKQGYSYSWWTKTFSVSGKKIYMYTASGWGGQHIMVFPELKAVVVFTGGNYVTRRPPYKILENYILPAIVHGNEKT